MIPHQAQGPGAMMPQQSQVGMRSYMDVDRDGMDEGIKGQSMGVGGMCGMDGGMDGDRVEDTRNGTLSKHSYEKKQPCRALTL